MVCTTETCGPNVRRAGIPLTDAQRTIRHQQIYGTNQLPPRGTGLNRVAPQQQKLEMNLGTFVGGVIIGFIIGGFLLTATGRDIGYRTGQKIAHKIY